MDQKREVPKNIRTVEKLYELFYKIYINIYNETQTLSRSRRSDGMMTCVFKLYKSEVSKYSIIGRKVCGPGIETTGFEG